MKTKTKKTRELLVVMSLRVPADLEITPGVYRDIKEAMESGGTAYDILVEKRLATAWPECTNMEFPYDDTERLHKETKLTNEKDVYAGLRVGQTKVVQVAAGRRGCECGHESTTMFV